MNITWRPYQKQCLDMVQKKRNKTKRQLIVMATGTGKRLLAVGISKDYERTLFLCHREELIDQAYRDFNRMYPLDVGIVKGTEFVINRKIVIASAQTMWRRLDRIPKDHFDCVMVDEAHHYLAPTYIQPLQFFDYRNSFGFTATPTRLDGLNFSNIMDEIVYEYPIQQAIKEGYLCQIEAHRIQTQIDISKVKKVGGDFVQKELSEKVDIPARNNLIVTKYQKYAPFRQALVFACDINHAINVSEKFKEHGISCEAVHSEMDQDLRRRYVQSFRDKLIDVLVNVEILTEGFDYEDIGAICMARPTQSLALYMQMIGRGTRVKSKSYQDKFMTNSCVILDFVDNTGNHKLVNTWTLDKEKTVEEKTFLTDEQREELMKKKEEAMAAQRQSELFEQHIREMRIKKFYIHDKPVDLLELPNLKINHRGRMLEPATEKQLDWLRNLGVWQSGMEYTKAQASEFITNAEAPDWMYQQLASWGYNVIGGATIGQYYEIKKKLDDIRREAEGKPRIFTPFIIKK